MESFLAPNHTLRPALPKTPLSSLFEMPYMHVPVFPSDRKYQDWAAPLPKNAEFPRRCGVFCLTFGTRAKEKTGGMEKPRSVSILRRAASLFTTFADFGVTGGGGCGSRRGVNGDMETMEKPWTTCDGMGGNGLDLGLVQGDLLWAIVKLSYTVPQPHRNRKQTGCGRGECSYIMISRDSAQRQRDDMEFRRASCRPTSLLPLSTK